VIVTIDGPAGAGKTTIAKRLAEALGYTYLDSGAMYRAVTLKAMQCPTPIGGEADWAALLAEARIELRQGRVWLDGRDVSQAIRRPEVTEATREASQSPSVREYLGRLQRRMGRHGSLVAEGRDMGTVVFPQAEWKFFLTASAEERARRRHRELAGAGHEDSLHSVLEAQNRRDEQDRKRSLSPLKPAPDAVVVDTTEMTIDEVVEHLKRLVLGKAKG